LWVADISYIPTWAGFLYLAVVLDAFSRKIVGWAMATHLRTELVLAALDMALGQRRPEGVIHHSDPFLPRVVTAGGDAQHAAHGDNSVHGLVSPYECERRDGVAPVS
jgi:hypothetical protein